MSSIVRGVARTVRTFIALSVRLLAWSVFATIAAIAAGGLVLALDHPQSEDLRPELTFRGAALVGPRLEGIHAPLEAMAAAAERLSGGGRTALRGLQAGDGAAVALALADGKTAVRELTAASEVARAERAGLLEGLAPARLPAAVDEEVGAIDDALAAADELAPLWRRIEDATGLPTAVLAAFDGYERLVVSATALGRDGRYPEALSALGRSDVAHEVVRGLREDAVGRGWDVTALDERIARWSDYRAALGDLYERLAASGGVRDADVTDALARVGPARAALPGDEQLAAVGMALGGTEIVPALLDMEGARGAIERAVAGPVDPAEVVQR